MDIAIVGMSCRLPGARTLAGFWDLIANGRSAISEVPPWRWDTSRLYHPDPSVPGTANTKWGGFIEDVELFDCDFFAMSAEEVPNVDPQQRLMLELGYEALEHAGIAPSSLRETRTGVYVGISHNDYDRIIYRDYSRITRHHGTGSYQSVAANRLSYFLDIVGPSMTVDTACSSGLTAVHIACRDLWERQVPLALVGAVTLHLTPDETIGLTKGRLLSGEGKCKSFDESADGYVRGEGGVVFVMRRLDDALAAGDRVLAVVKGSAVNHNGRSNGLTAPSARALKAVMEEALAASGVRAEDVSFVETHGTGTLMGDQLELKALKEVYGSRAFAGPCWLGCLKTNIGHLETTSGLASLVKMTLAMQHERIPANLNLVKPMRRADLLESRFAFPARLEEWTAGAAPRVGALTAYGFGGANAHVVVQEAPPVVARPCAGARPQVLCLSARNERALSELLIRYAAYLAVTDDSLDSICYTANVGRSHFSRRLAFVASNVEDLRAQLQRAVADGSTGVDASRPPRVASACAHESALVEELAALYMRGVAIDFAAVHRGDRPRRASLPTYPFQRARLWFDPPGGWIPTALLPAAAAPVGMATADMARDVSVRCVDVPRDTTPEDMTAWLSDLIGAELQMASDDVDADRPFAEYGVDSAAAVEIASKVQTRMGRDIDATLLWSYPNITTLARHLKDLLVAAP